VAQLFWRQAAAITRVIVPPTSIWGRNVAGKAFVEVGAMRARFVTASAQV
jgi:hypothetical protein